MIAVAATSTGLLTFQRNRATRLPNAMSAVSQSPIAIFPNRTHAPRIVPMAAAYAPLMKPWTFGFPRWRTRTGATMSTRRKEGRENSSCRDERAPEPRDKIAYERGRDDDRARADHSHSHCDEKLSLIESAGLLDEPLFQKRGDHESAAEREGASRQEERKQFPEN